MSTSYDPDRLTKTHLETQISRLESKLSLLESKMKTEITRQVTGLMIGAFLALTYIAFWAMIIVAVATDTKAS